MTSFSIPKASQMLKHYLCVSTIDVMCIDATSETEAVKLVRFLKKEWSDIDVDVYQLAHTGVVLMLGSNSETDAP